MSWLCQFCLAQHSMRIHREESSSGQVVESYYCLDCYEAKFLKPDSAVPFPWPRFTLKRMMILVAVWAVPNAIAAWLMTSEFITNSGTPAQVRQWTGQTFLYLNLGIAFDAMLIGLTLWMNHLLWYKRTGGLVPIPTPPKETLSQILAIVTCASVSLTALTFAALFLTSWLTPKIWPTQRHNPLLFAMFMGIPLAPFVVRGVAKNHVLKQRIKSEWRTASGIERSFNVISMVWLFGFFLLILVISSLPFWKSITTRFVIPNAIMLLVWLIGLMILKTATVMSTRRR